MEESVIEKPILDIKRTKLTDLVEACIVFNQATLDKAKKEESDILRLERRILELEEEVELEKSNRLELNQLKDYIVQSNESRSKSQRFFYEKTFNLHEITLKVIILLKKAQVDEELGLQVNKDLEFIKEAQRIVQQGNHNIKSIESEELRQRRMEIKYLNETVDIIKK